jgi:hypothetical protein
MQFSEGTTRGSRFTRPQHAQPGIFVRPSGEVGSVKTPSERNQGRSTIRLNAKTGYRSNRRIRYRVRIDGQSMGLIAEGESFDFLVPPGDHRIRLRVELTVFSAEKAVSLEDGQVTKFVCLPGWLSWIWPLSIFWPARLNGPIQVEGRSDGPHDPPMALPAITAKLNTEPAA